MAWKCSKCGEITQIGSLIKCLHCGYIISEHELNACELTSEEIAEKVSNKEWKLSFISFSISITSLVITLIADVIPPTVEPLYWSFFLMYLILPAILIAGLFMATISLFDSPKGKTRVYAISALFLNLLLLIYRLVFPPLIPA